MIKLSIQRKINLLNYTIIPPLPIADLFLRTATFSLLSIGKPPISETYFNLNFKIMTKLP